MILHINDKTNSAKPLYYQSLILLFLPCEKFSQSDNENNLYVDARELNGTFFAEVKLQVGDRVSKENASESVDTSKYAQMKNLIGRTLLKCAKSIFGITPPWGISTGVKPVKLARMFVNSLGADEAFRVLTEDYSISPSKAKMAVDACVHEDRMMENMGKDPCSVYLSIPFCPTRCSYCSFVSCATPRLFSLIPDYLNALENEIFAVSDVIRQRGLEIKSIYIGGGTPAILTPEQINRLLYAVNNKLQPSESVELTFEAGRPDCITREKLFSLHENGVGRISINTQTTNDEILRSVGRSHTFSDYVSAMDMAKNVGFDCINTDLIAGLPGETPDSFCKSVRDVAQLAPENITIHAFTLKKASSIRIGGEKSFEITPSEALKMTDYSAEYLGQIGYSPYYVYRQKNTAGNLENVGYSIKGRDSIYNVVMMGEYHTVFGIGAGSVTKLVLDGGKRVERIFAPKYPYEFLDQTKYSGFDKSAVLSILEER